MAIDFTLAPEHEEIRNRVRTFVEETIKPAIEPFRAALQQGKFYSEWKAKFGDEAWAKLEAAVGKLV
mgnify:CR=1 FL=1